MAQGAPISFLPKELTHHNVRIQRERPAQRRREDEWVRILKILGTVQRERERERELRPYFGSKSGCQLVMMSKRLAAII